MTEIVLIPCLYDLIDQMGWPHELSVHLPFWGDRRIRTHGFELWPRQTIDLEIDTLLLPSQEYSIVGIRKGQIGSMSV